MVTGVFMSRGNILLKNKLPKSSIINIYLYITIAQTYVRRIYTSIISIHKLYYYKILIMENCFPAIARLLLV